MPFSAGETVKYSLAGLQEARDFWNKQGEASRKARALAEFKALEAKRGTVQEGEGALNTSFYTVKWEDGYTSQTSSYLLTRA